MSAGLLESEMCIIRASKTDFPSVLRTGLSPSESSDVNRAPSHAMVREIYLRIWLTELRATEMCVTAD